MFERFTDRARKVMALANQEAQRLNHEYLDTEHILLGLVKDGAGVGANVLKNLDVDLRKIPQEVEKLVKTGPRSVSWDKLPQAPAAKKVIECAIEEARHLNHNYVGSEHLLLGLLREAKGVAAQVLVNLGLKLEVVREEVLNLLGAGDNANEPGSSRQHKGKTPVLDGFGIDLIDQVHKGAAEPVVGRHSEVMRLVEILCRRRINNAILVGKAGVGKSKVVDGLAHRFISTELPVELIDKRLVSIDLATLAARAKDRPQFDEIIKTILKEIQRSRDVILFIRDLKTMFGHGDGELGFDAARNLQLAIDRGEVQILSTATPEIYAQCLARDPRFVQQFQRVSVFPPTGEQTLEILRGLRGHYESHHRVRIADGALQAAVELSDRYIETPEQPTRAIHLIDEAAARVRLKRLIKFSPAMMKLDAEILKLNEEKDAFVKAADYERAAEIRDKSEQLRKQKEKLQREWRESPENAEGTVDDNSIEDIVAEQTGVTPEIIRKRASVPDLIKALPTIKLSTYERLQVESILTGTDVRIVSGSGFVLMPLSPPFAGVYAEAIKPAMESNGISSSKADDISESGAILQQVWQHIRSAEVVVVDASSANPNVMFELGLCFALRRCPIVILQDPDHLPFTLRSLRYFPYKDSAAGIAKLKQDLTIAVREFLNATRSQSREGA